MRFQILLISMLGTSTLMAQSDRKIIDLVNKTCRDINNVGAASVIQQINQSKTPYVSKYDADLYSFIYNDKAVLLAHPKKTQVGKSLKGVPDVTGNRFRDTIVEGALSKNSGWVNYIYKKPNSVGLYEKRSYYSLCKTPSQNLIVVSGKYLKKK